MTHSLICSRAVSGDLKPCKIIRRKSFRERRTCKNFRKKLSVIKALKKKCSPFSNFSSYSPQKFCLPGKLLDFFGAAQTIGNAYLDVVIELVWFRFKNFVQKKLGLFRTTRIRYAYPWVKIISPLLCEVFGRLRIPKSPLDY